MSLSSNGDPRRHRHPTGLGTEPLVRRSKTIVQRYAMAPPKTMQAADVEQLARRTVRLTGVEGDINIRSRDVANALGKLTNGQIFPGANINVILAVVALHEEKTRIGEIIDVQELSPGSAGPPDYGGL